MITEVLMAFIGVVSFAVLLGVPKSEWIYAGLTGAIGRAVFTGTNRLLSNNIYATLIAAIIVTLLSRIFAGKRRVPGIVYLRAGVFPLVPGASIYYTAYYIFSHEGNMAAISGIEALTRALALAFGIMISSQIPQRFFSAGRTGQGAGDDIKMS